MAKPSDPLLDLSVARRTFGEAEELHANRAAFAALRWEIVRPAFPTLTVFRQRRDGARLIGVRLQLRNYDFTAASLAYVAPDGAPVNWPTLAPVVGSFPHPSGKPMRYIVEAHSATGLPFLCKAGTWEYHTHVQHRHDRWDAYRGIISLQSVITMGFDALDQRWLAQ